MKLHAACKINIGLDILRRREDGFHDLETVMVPVRGLYDTLDVEPCEEGIRFAQSGIAIDCPDEKNLCVRAARLMQQHYGIAGVAITLDKRIPFGAGLGGGSSDATAVIRAIDSLYGLGLGSEELVARAAELGSDTAFFVHNTPQLCRGRGEVMEPIELPLAGLYLAVAKPEEGVSTAEAYASVRPAVPTVRLQEAIKRPISEWQGIVKNDFEGHILNNHPAIRELKEQLLQAGALYASMSGSGSAVFGLFDHEPKIATNQFLHIEQL